MGHSLWNGSFVQLGTYIFAIQSKVESKIFCRENIQVDLLMDTQSHLGYSNQDLCCIRENLGKFLHL